MGSAGQAMDAFRVMLAWFSTGTPCSAKMAVTAALSCSAIFASTTFWEGVSRTSQENLSVIWRNAAFKRASFPCRECVPLST